MQKGFAAIGTDNGVVLDATFASRSKRDLLRDQCASAGFRLQAIELEADRQEVAKRVKGRDKNKLEVSNARLEDLDGLSAVHEPPTEIADVIKVSTTGSLLHTVRSVLMHLADKVINQRPLNLP